jgi:riboflavin synthase alpha subunit
VTYVTKAPPPCVRALSVHQVNGVCLTVTKFDKKRFTVGVPRTCAHTHTRKHTCESDSRRPKSSPLTLHPSPVPSNQVAPETLRLTNLGDLTTGSRVNLERAAAIDGRNSGHMVQVLCIETDRDRQRERERERERY